MALSQTDRMIQITTPLGEDTLMVLNFSGTEKISKLFRFKMELVSERNDITFEELAGKNITVSIRSGATERHFNGMMISFQPTLISHTGGYSKYMAEIAPAAWSLTQCMDCRIFQDKDIKEIIADVLSSASLGAKKVHRTIEYRLELLNGYTKREYCVQFNETDMDFIRRLCEDEGIFYFFEHSNGSHTMVFADSPGAHKPFAADPVIRYQNTTGAYLEDEVITRLDSRKNITSGIYTARDYNFRMPDNTLEVYRKTVEGGSQSQGEIYEYPGGYENSNDQGTPLARIRMQAQDTLIQTINGQSNSRGFVPGYRFTLLEHPMAAMNNLDYVFVSVNHRAKQGLHSGSADGDFYGNEFSCIPYNVPYRPLRETSKPLIHSSQTATVTGPQAEEIHTDKYGRVKVRFPWDRRSRLDRDGNYSCWIRVSQSWAGGKYGSMHIPRVGQEVIVNFLDGNPDRPVITGRVYNANYQVPYNLPAEKTKSTIRSSSSKGGSNFNEIRFEDLAGSEEIFTHAAKDQNEVIEEKMTTRVGTDQQITVAENRSVTVTGGNETLAVQSGGRSVDVKSDETHTNMANFKHKVWANYDLKVNGNLNINASGIVTINGAKLILNG